MTSVFSLQNCQPLPCFILYSKAKFAHYSRYFLISYFFIPVLYSEKDIFFGFQFWKVLQVFIEPFNFSFFSIIGQGIDLDYCDIEWFALETTEIILLFLRLRPSTAFQTLLLTLMATPFLLRDSCPWQCFICQRSRNKADVALHMVSEREMVQEAARRQMTLTAQVVCFLWTLLSRDMM